MILHRFHIETRLAEPLRQFTDATGFVIPPLPAAHKADYQQLAGFERHRNSEVAERLAAAVCEDGKACGQSDDRIADKETGHANQDSAGLGDS